MTLQGKCRQVGGAARTWPCMGTRSGIRLCHSSGSQYAYSEVATVGFPQQWDAWAAFVSCLVPFVFGL